MVQNVERVSDIGGVCLRTEYEADKLRKTIHDLILTTLPLENVSLNLANW